MPRADPVAALRAPVAFLVLYLGLRALLLLQPGYRDDLVAYRRWAVTASQQGLAQVYRASDMDYPPLYAYLLWPLGRAYAWLSPGVGTRSGGDPAVWLALVKLPPLAFDLAIGGLLFQVGSRAERAPNTLGPGLRPPPWRLLLPGAYLANPAVVFDTGYWGHPDSIHSFFVAAAFVLVALGRAGSAFAALALATTMKPLAAPFFPLLGLFALMRSGLAGLLRGAAAAAATTAAVFAPFLLSGDGGFVLQRVVLDLDAMPYTAVNAHNLWGALGGWRPAETPWLGPLSATQIGLLLFAIALGGILRRAWQAWSDPGQASLAAAGVLAAALAASFFMLSTHMHENHLFSVVPLLALALPAGTTWQRLYVAASLAVLLNLVLHDPVLPGRYPFTLGGVTDVARPSHGRSYFAAELLAVRAATAFNLALAGVFAYLVYKRAPPLARVGEGRDDGRSLR